MLGPLGDPGRQEGRPASAAGQHHLSPLPGRLSAGHVDPAPALAPRWGILKAALARGGGGEQCQGLWVAATGSPVPAISWPAAATFEQRRHSRGAALLRVGRAEGDISSGTSAWLRRGPHPQSSTQARPRPGPVCPDPPPPVEAGEHRPPGAARVNRGRPGPAPSPAATSFHTFSASGSGAAAALAAGWRGRAVHRSSAPTPGRARQARRPRPRRRWGLGGRGAPWHVEATRGLDTGPHLF